MTTLTEAQIKLLAHAAATPDGALDAPGDAKLAKPLIKSGLMIAQPKVEGGGRLLITDAGRAAIGIAIEAAKKPAETPPSDPAPANPAAAPKSAAPKGKLGAMVALLKQPEGSTIEAMMAATGWQAHSVRGAMSGALKKKLGLAITSDKTDGVRIYRVVDGGAA